MNDAAGPKSANRRLLAILVLLAGLLVVSTISTIVLQSRGPQASAPTPATTVTLTALAADSGEAVAVVAPTISGVTPTIAPATPFGVLGLDTGPTPETMPATPLPNVSSIRLLGPPAGSQFGLNDTVTFYWDWPEHLDDTMRFAVYLRSDSGLVLGGTTAEEDNLGAIQQLSIRPSEVVVGPAANQWQIVVEDRTTGMVLAQSENRPIIFLVGE